jgi:hypothetical protein
VRELMNISLALCGTGAVKPDKVHDVDGEKVLLAMNFDLVS